MKYTSFTKSLLVSALVIGASFVQNVQAQCFDMTASIGTDSNIQFRNYDVQYNTQTGYYDWVMTNPRAAGFPRHTLMTAAGQDALVPALSVLPPNGKNSILCASDTYEPTDIYAKGTLLAFYYTVTKENPIVYLNYAAVLEKSNHALAKTSGFEQYAQPWITIYASVDGEYFIDCPELTVMPYSNSSSVSGWTTVTDTKGRAAYWKDWTTMTLDMTQYIGHTVMFTFETHDCAEKAYNSSNQQITLCTDHEQARLYVSMDCASSEIQHDCAGKGTNLTAPDGFKTYKWYATSAPSRTLGTAQTLYVEPTATTEYTCQGTAECGTTTLKTTVTPNIFDLGTVELCNGKSFVLGDTTLRTNGTYTRTIPRRGKCDSIATVTMAFGDGDRYTLSDVYIKEGESVRVGDSIFRTEGPHTSIIKRNDNCDSIVTLNIYFNDPVPTPEGCVDFTQLGNRNVIRCINYDLRKTLVNNGVKYGPWDETEMTADNHPRQRLMTSRKNDETVPSLKVLPDGAQYSIRCGSEGYGTDDTLGKGTMTAFYLTIDKTNAIVSMSSAMILEKSNHAVMAYPNVYKTYAQPYINMYLYNRTDNEIIWQEDFYPVSDPASVTGGKWTEYSNSSHSYHWRDWDTQRFDLSQYIGKEMCFVYVTHDCAISGGSADGQSDIVPCRKNEIARLYAHVSCEGIVTECIGTAKMKQDTVCADAQNLAIEVKFTEGIPSSYDLRFSDAAKAAGFKDVTGAALNLDRSGNGEIAINLEAANPTTDGTPWYKRPGTYQVTVAEHGECDNNPQQTLTFTLLYPETIITQRWNDVMALNNSNYNGGYAFSRIRWFHEGEGEISGRGDHNSYLYRPLQTGTAYWAELTRSSDGQTVCTCRKIAVHQDDATAFDDNQMVHIRRMNAPQAIEIATEISGHYYMYDALGRMISTGTFGHEYGNMTINLSEVHSNMVIITFHGNEGTKETKKLIAF